jgi:hypothetical protein
VTREAGTVLKAAAALQRGQQTFTGEQVAYLMHLAYDAGRTATILDDLAQVHASFAAHSWRQTYEQWVTAQIAAMEATADRQPWNTWRGQYPGGPVDWETGRPLHRLEIAA